MPVGPPGWTHQMHQEHECEFVSMARALASAEVGFVGWFGVKLLRGVEGFVYFFLGLSRLVGGGEFGGLGKGGLGWCLPLAGGGAGNDRRSSAWEGELCEGFQ